MNQHTTRVLRRAFTPPFPGFDPRNRTAWRQFKRDFQAIPRPDRHRVLVGMQAAKDAFVS